MNGTTSRSSVKASPEVNSQMGLGLYRVDGPGREQTKIGHYRMENVMSLA